MGDRKEVTINGKKIWVVHNPLNNLYYHQTEGYTDSAPYLGLGFKTEEDAEVSLDNLVESAKATKTAEDAAPKFQQQSNEDHNKDDNQENNQV